jgi:hypothetical protein
MTVATDCGVIAVRLLVIVVFEPVLSPTTSVFCLLITLYVRVFWLKNDRVAARMCARCCGFREA